MGHYTQLKLNLKIKPESQLQKDIITSLYKRDGYIGQVHFNRPKLGEVHEFFLCDRASYIFCDMNKAFCKNSYTSPEEVQAKAEQDKEWAATLTEDDYWYGIFKSEPYDRTYWNEETGELRIRASIKNYDNEFEKFIDWVKPYADLEQSDNLAILVVDDPEEGMLVQKVFLNEAIEDEKF